MVVSARLAWIVEQLRSGCSARLGINIHEGKLIANVLLIPDVIIPAVFREFLINQLCSLDSLAQGLVVYDHGHRYSSGRSKVSFCVRTPSPQRTMLVNEVAEPTAAKAGDGPVDLGPSAMNSDGGTAVLVPTHFVSIPRAAPPDTDSTGGSVEEAVQTLDRMIAEAVANLVTTKGQLAMSGQPGASHEIRSQIESATLELDRWRRV
mmetsp:Transcript_163195/g.523429  ORF Transcript_163195/g.523429 Transcript_163195/m.523429 type:complete len:206 (+) Transcript_163195:98-715(+)